MTLDSIQQLDGALVSAVQKAQDGVVRVETERGASASGSVFAPNLIVTSNAELGRGEAVQIGTHDGKTLEVELVGRDPAYDLALLRVSAELPALQFTDASTLATGRIALALGRPGRAIRASLRIVGLVADDVETPSGAKLARYVESDRGFPPGFAGGPLIDVEGRALGMNSARLIRGADLALPHASLERSVALLLAHGTIPRGHLGVAAQPVRLPRNLREQLGRRSGALVLGIESNSPAERAGVLFGDTIIGLDGQSVSGPR